MFVSLIANDVKNIGRAEEWRKREGRGEEEKGGEGRRGDGDKHASKQELQVQIYVTICLLKFYFNAWQILHTKQMNKQTSKYPPPPPPTPYTRLVLCFYLMLFSSRMAHTIFLLLSTISQSLIPPAHTFHKAFLKPSKGGKLSISSEFSSHFLFFFFLASATLHSLLEKNLLYSPSLLNRF